MELSNQIVVKWNYQTRSWRSGIIKPGRGSGIINPGRGAVELSNQWADLQDIEAMSWSQSVWPNGHFTRKVPVVASSCSKFRSYGTNME